MTGNFVQVPRSSGPARRVQRERRGATKTSLAVRQYSRTATSKYQVRRISITSKSRANPGGNA